MKNSVGRPMDGGWVCARPAFPMKVFVAILALTMITAGALRAQEARNAFVLHPYASRGDLAASRFWTLPTVGLVALDGAAKTVDSFATRKNIDGGGAEYNPMARPFVHTTSVQVVATAALFGAEVAAAYFLHRKRHDRLGQAVLFGGAIMNGLGAASSIKYRVAGW